MNKPKGQTVGFTLSAAVPIESVGFVLKAMFDAGCPPSGLDLKAIVDGSVIKNGYAAPTQKKHASNFKAEHLREAMLAVMAAQTGPIQRKDLFVMVREKLGEHVSHARLGTVASEFMRGGQIKSDGGGLYTLTKIGRRDADTTHTETGA